MLSNNKAGHSGRPGGHLRDAADFEPRLGAAHPAQNAQAIDLLYELPQVTIDHAALHSRPS
jgi:hypothetical protein